MTNDLLISTFSFHSVSLNFVKARIFDLICCRYISLQSRSKNIKWPKVQENNYLVENQVIPKYFGVFSLTHKFCKTWMTVVGNISNCFLHYYFLFHTPLPSVFSHIIIAWSSFSISNAGWEYRITYTTDWPWWCHLPL